MKIDDELALKIGRHVLNTFNDYSEGNKILGLKLVIPVQIPRKRSSKEFKYIYPNFSDFIVNVDIPRLIMKINPEEMKSITISEYYKIAKELGFELDNDQET